MGRLEVKGITKVWLIGGMAFLVTIIFVIVAVHYQNQIAELVRENSILTEENQQLLANNTQLEDEILELNATYQKEIEYLKQKILYLESNETIPESEQALVLIAPELIGKVEVETRCKILNEIEYEARILVKNVWNQTLFVKAQLILKTEKEEVIFVEKDVPHMEATLSPGNHILLGGTTGGYWLPKGDWKLWTITVKILSK